MSDANHSHYDHGESNNHTSETSVTTNKKSPSDENVEYLKEQITRLTTELLHYQKLAGIVTQNYHDENTNHGIELPSWIFSSEVCQPLFIAYDLRIEQLGQYLEQQGVCLDNLTQRCNTLIEENQSLRSKNLQHSTLKSNEFISSNTNRILSPTCKRDERFESREEIKLLHEQSELLIAELKDSNEQILSRDKNISFLTNQIQEQLRAIQKFQMTIQQLRKDKTVCEDELVKKVNKSHDLEEEISRLKNVSTHEKVDRENLSTRLNDILMERDHYQKEAEDLSQKIIYSSKRVQELQAKLSSQTSDYEKLIQNHKATEEELLVVRKQAHDTKKILNQTESKLEHQTHNKDTFDKMKRDFINQIQEITLARDKLQVKCNTLQQEIERICRQQSNLSDEKSTFEDHDKLLDKIQEEHSVMMETRNKKIHQLNLENTELSIQLDEIRREFESMKALYSKAEKCIEKERTVSKQRIEELHQNVNDISAKLTTQIMNKDHILEEKQSLEHRLLSVEGNLSKTRTDLEKVQNEYSRQMKESIEKQSIQQEEFLKQSIQLRENLERIKDEKNTLEDKLVTVTTTKDAEIKRWKEELESLKENSKSYTKVLEEQMNNNKNVLKDLKHERTNRNHMLEQSLNDTRHECQELSEEIVALKEKINVLTDEKYELESVLREREQSFFEMSLSLQSTEEKVVFLGKQLKDVLQEQGERLANERKLKSKLRRMHSKMNKLRDMQSCDVDTSDMS